MEKLECRREGGVRDVEIDEVFTQTLSQLRQGIEGGALTIARILLNLQL
jgi:hypothetical protein